MEFTQWLHTRVYKPFLQIYLRFNTHTSTDGFKLKIVKGVFHPGFFFSSKYLYTFIAKQELKDLNFLELGCGSGILSLLALRKGARVTSVDVDVRAVNNTLVNLKANFKDDSGMQVLQSDLFDSLSNQHFDFIVINPPYFFKKVESENQLAWNCGENGDYFEKLFGQIAKFAHSQTRIYMVLADNCEIDRIKRIAQKHRVVFTLAESKKIKWETNYIFSLGIN